MSNEITTIETVQKYFVQDNVKEKFSEVLNDKAPQFMTSVVNAIRGNASLQKCEAQSIISSALVAATYDLPIDGNLGFSAIVPYGGKAQFQMMYKGFVQLAIRSGAYKNMHVSEVYEDEIETYNPITGELEFVKAAIKDGFRLKGNTDKIVGYYAMFKLLTGFQKELYMTVEEVTNHAKKYSASYKQDLNKGWSSSKWTSDFQSMAKKGLALDTPIPTIDGWKTMQDMSVGDIVFDMNGKKTAVVAVSEIKNLPCFKITFSNGESIICDDEHRWVAEIGTNCSRRVKEQGWKTYTVNELYEAKQNGDRVVIPATPIINTNDNDHLPIEPWVLGYWLGNGGRGHANVTCCIDDLNHIIGMIAQSYEVGAIRQDPRSKAVNIGIKDNLLTSLREECVLNVKHIPKKYLRAGIEQRTKLLQGLVDSDGCIDKERGRVKFNSTSEVLANNVLELVVSLGERVHMSKRKQSGYGKVVDCYTVEWKPSRVVPATMPRKLERIRERQLDVYNSIKSVEKIDSVPTKCIAVSSDTKTYLAGRSMIPTHNTVLKLLLSKWGILSIDMQRAIQDDQKVYDDGGNSNYSDNPDSKPTELPFNPWENVVDAEVAENGVEQQ